MVATAIIVIVISIQAIMHRGKSSSSKSNTNGNGISLVNDGSNTNTTTTNANQSTNTNSAVATTDSWTNFSTTTCPAAIGSFGTAKTVALTFDVSAANDQAHTLLDQLKQKKTPATWFSTGDFADKNSDFIRAIAQAGYGVYSRGQKSVDMTTLTSDQIATSLQNADDSITNATGRTAKPLLRPPFGNVSSGLVTAAKADGYCVVTWTVDGFDWKDGATADDVVARVMAKLAPGMIIDLHAGYDVTPAAVSALLDQLKTKGYTTTSLANLLQSS